jgi:hypothetical protein
MNSNTLNDMIASVANNITGDDLVSASNALLSVSNDYCDSDLEKSRIQLNMVAHDISGDPY